MNEAEVLNVLERRGFETVVPERMSVAEQIELYSQARVVVGAHGARLTGAVFATELTLLELFQPEFFTPPFFALAGACDWDYWYLTCEASGQVSRSRDSDIVVPVDRLEEAIDEILRQI